MATPKNLDTPPPDYFAGGGPSVPENQAPLPQSIPEMQSPQIPSQTFNQAAPPQAPQQQTPSPQPTPQLPQQPPFQFQEPADRGGLVKNVLTRMLYGMGQAGLAHVGLPTDYEIQRTQYQQALQAGQQQIAQAHEQLLQQAQQFQQQTVDTPLGPMPKQTWEKIGPAVYSGMFRTQATQIAHNFIPTPRGIYDVQAGDFR